jgi:putative endonuclease
MKEFFVYIMSNHSRTLYVGITNDLERRVWEHTHGTVKGFTSWYRMTKLVYFEGWPSINEAIGREKQLKGWLRTRKLALIERRNPDWDDLSSGWFGHQDSSLRSE